MAPVGYMEHREPLHVPYIELEKPMTRILNLTVSIINKLHDYIVNKAHAMGLGMTDKQLHFWLLGIIGLFFFLVCDVVFRQLAKWSVSAITFVYTFTILVVLVLAIEIEQKMTRAGNMEFQDIVAGLSGFVALFLVFAFVRIIIREIRK